MSMIGTKTPDEIKDYSLDWSKDIGTDIIASGGSTWNISPASATLTQSSVATSGTLTTVWISGGVLGQVYEVKNLIVTTGGRDLSKTFRLLVETNNYL
jgi:hypothetical protein